MVNCDGTKSGIVLAKSCTIPILILKGAPFNLLEGSSIYATIIATNLFGNSDASNPGNGAFIPIAALTLYGVINEESILLLPSITNVKYIMIKMAPF